MHVHLRIASKALIATDWRNNIDRFTFLFLSTVSLNSLMEKDCNRTVSILKEISRIMRNLVLVPKGVETL